MAEQKEWSNEELNYRLKFVEEKITHLLKFAKDDFYKIEGVQTKINTFEKKYFNMSMSSHHFDIVTNATEAALKTITQKLSEMEKQIELLESEVKVLTIQNL